MAKVQTVEQYIAEHPERANELNRLRKLVLQFPFEESIKWRMPSYSYNNSNIIGIGIFKNWSCLWFHHGSLLEDKEKVLENAQEDKTKGMRQWRFRKALDLDEDLVVKYLQESLDNVKQGKVISYAKPNKVRIELPPLLEAHLNENVKHNKTYNNFTVAQQNEFCNYIIEAKREKTKLDRIEKIRLLEEEKKLSSLWAG